jgi:hypothetical protein
MYSPLTAGTQPHLLTPGLEFVLGQALAHRLTRELVVIGQPHHLLGQQLDRPAGTAFGWA